MVSQSWIRNAARVDRRRDDDTGIDEPCGMQHDSPLILRADDAVSAKTVRGSTAAAVDEALLAWAALGSDDDDTELLTNQAADELALMLLE